MFHHFGIFRRASTEGSRYNLGLKNEQTEFQSSEVPVRPRVSLIVCAAGHLEDRLSRFTQPVSLSFLALFHHLLCDALVLAQHRLLLCPLAPRLHPRDQAQHGSSDERGDSCEVEGHVVAAQSVPQEACKRRETKYSDSGCVALRPARRFRGQKDTTVWLQTSTVESAPLSGPLHHRGGRNNKSTK